MAAGERSRYGSGLYKRGAVWWVRVRTPGALKKNISRSLWRFSLGASSSTQASVAARFVRAALDRGFAMVGVWAGERVLDTAQMEAILGQLARQALAESETLRAPPCARSEADVSVAKAAHLRAAAGWREALRLNDLTAAAPLVMAAADAVGLAGPGAAPNPIVLREAARMLAAVAEENVAREDGVYAADRTLLQVRLCAAAPAVPMVAAPASIAPAPDRAPDQGPRPTITTAVRSEAAATAPDAMVSIADTAAPTPEDPAVERRCDLTPGISPSPPPSVDTLLAMQARRPALMVAPPHPGPAPLKRRLTPPASAASAADESTIAALTTGRRKAPRRAQRRARPDDRMLALRQVGKEDVWNLSLEEAFALTRDRHSIGGTNQKWMKGSSRGFDATTKLALAWFRRADGKPTALSAITEGDCREFVERLGDVPNNWGKSAALDLPMRSLVDRANDDEEAALTAIEQLAEVEGWSGDRFAEACAAARIARLAPRTQYKHQTYVSMVFKCIIGVARAGENPMADAIWPKKHLKQLIAFDGPRRRALGRDGLAALFSRPIFTSGPERSNDPLYWLPLMGRYAGLRMEEGCQLKPCDIAIEAGAPVILVRASSDQAVKSVNAIRTMPIHPELLRCGILKLVAAKRAAGSPWLFDVERNADGTFSSTFSKKYHNWRRTEGIYEPGKDFHSLRKDFYQAMKAAKVDYAARVVLMGHALNDVSETNYGHREWEIDDLRGFIEAIATDTGKVRPAII